LGVVFQGSPPRITDIRAGSPVENIITEGMYIQAVSAPGVQFLGIQTADDVGKRLLQFKESPKRKMVLSHRPADMEATIKCQLPEGPIHLGFSGNDPTPSVNRVWDKCPFKDIIEIGMKIIALQVPGKGGSLHTSFSGWDLDRALKKSEKMEGRILVLTKPSTTPGKLDPELQPQYPTAETVGSHVHKRDAAANRFGRDTEAPPSMRLGLTVDFNMRSGLPGFASMEDAYHFDDYNGKTFLRRHFRFVDYLVTSQTEGKTKELVLQDGQEKLGVVLEHPVGSNHCAEIHTFHPRQTSDVPNGQIRFERKLYNWARVLDRSWKDQIEYHDIQMWKGGEWQTLYQVKCLDLSNYHMILLNLADGALMATMFRREYTDNSGRRKWAVCMSPGVDPCFMMCITASIDKLIL